MTKKSKIFYISFLIISISLILAILNRDFLFSFFKINKNKTQPENTLEKKYIYTQNLFLNGKEFDKTAFVYVQGATVKGSDAFSTDTIPANRIEFYENSDEVPHVLQQSIFSANTNITIDSFFIGAYEVTQELYNYVMGQFAKTFTEYDINPSPSYFKMDVTSGEKQELRPVERVSWYDAILFCNSLSALCGFDCCYEVSNAVIHPDTGSCIAADVSFDISKNGFRLPTESEWEYACRGCDTESENWNFTYAGSNKIEDVAWFCTEGNFNIKVSDDEYTRIGLTHEVGLKKANSIGIFDMIGNVQEWCFDDYHKISNHKQKRNLDNPFLLKHWGIESTENPNLKVARGGSWYRVSGESTVNFRLALKDDSRNIGCGIRLVRRPYQDE